MLDLSRRLFAIEGIELSGKSTLCGLLKENLEARGYPSQIVSDWDTALGKTLKQHKDPIDSVAQVYALCALRAEAVRTLVLPCLARGMIVLYEGTDEQVNCCSSVALYEQIVSAATIGLAPILTLWLDTPVGECRIRYENAHGEGNENYERILAARRSRYETLWRNSSDRVSRLDGSQPLDKYADQAIRLLEGAIY